MSIRSKQWRIVFLFCLSILYHSVFSQEPEYIALVTEIEGNVHIENAYHGRRNCVWGTQLHHGDQIQTSENGRVSLLFSNGNLIRLGPSSAMTISSGQSAASESIGKIESDLAADLSAIIIQDDEKGDFDALAGLRSAETSEIILLFPCNTTVSDSRPSFRWSSKKSFESYRLTLFSSEGPVWSKETAACALSYPEEEKPLPGEGSFFWMVEGVDILSSSSSTRAGFTVLPKHEADIIHEYESKIKEIFGGNTDCTSYHTIMGVYFEKNGLLGDAIREFEIIAETNSDSALPHEILGRLYHKAGLKDLAILELQKALKLSKDQDTSFLPCK